MGMANFANNQIRNLIKHSNSYKTVERYTKDLYIRHNKLTCPISLNYKIDSQTSVEILKKKKKYPKFSYRIFRVYCFAWHL